MTNALALSAAAVALLFTSLSARAAYVVDLTEEVVGGVNEVVASGSGTIDLTDLSFFFSISAPVAMTPNLGVIETGGPTPSIFTDQYSGRSTGPTPFGSGTGTLASSGSGDAAGVTQCTGACPPNPNLVEVPLGYHSGDPLSGTSTYSGQTFASLGVTPGTYEWTWGSGAHADSFTLQIGPAAVPEPSTWAMILAGFAGLAFAGWRARGGFRLAA
jgi:hypothetical protein